MKMIDNNKIKISVLIMAYKRKEFIKEALISVLNQTVERDAYEIVCSLGFVDEDITSFMMKNNIKSIFCDGLLGERLYYGIKSCKGDIIAFLDDDDRFTSNKLELILNAFNKCPNCIYYHNNIKLIDVNSKPIDYKISPFNFQIKKTFIELPLKNIQKILKERGDFNMSSIAVRRAAIEPYLEYLKQIDATPDSIIFFFLMQNSQPFYFDTMQTTEYRIHKSETNMQSFENGLSITNTAIRFFRSRQSAYENLKSEKVRKIFLGYVLESKLSAYIVGAEELKPTRTDLLKFLIIGIKRRNGFYLRLLVATVIFSKFPNFVRKIQQERLNAKYKKRKSLIFR
jgi:glycosyltransferase involved in cell wall biosynthesis